MSEWSRTPGCARSGKGRPPALYTPDYNGEFLVRVSGDARQWIEPLRAALSEVDAASAQDVRPLRDAVEGAMIPMQVAAGFVGSLSGLGLVLALVGLYGSASFAAGRRTREMGIRVALGATRGRILLAALRDGMVVALCGILIGLALAVAAIRPLSTCCRQASTRGIRPCSLRLAHSFWQLPQ